MRLGSAGRFHHRHPAERVAADVEHHRVPVGGHDLVGPALQALAPEVGPGVVGRLGDRPGDLVVVGQPLEARPGGPATAPGAGRGTAGPWPPAGRRPSAGRALAVAVDRPVLGRPSRPGDATDIGSDSRPVSTSSQRRRTSAPTSSAPTHSSPCSSAYFLARSSSSHWTSSAVIRGAVRQSRAARAATGRSDTCRSAATGAGQRQVAGQERRPRSWTGRWRSCPP